MIETETAPTAKDEIKKYGPVHGVLVMDPQGVCANQALTITANVALDAYRIRTDPTCIIIAIPGLGALGMTAEQCREFVSQLVIAHSDVANASRIAKE